MPLRNFRAPLRLPLRGRGDKYERNWQQLERTINAQTPLCYGSTATVNGGAPLAATTVYYAIFTPPAAVQDRWQMIDPVLLGGVTQDGDPAVIRVPWDGLWDLQVTWVLIPVAGAQTGYRFTLESAPYYDAGIAATFTILDLDSTNLFPTGSENVVYRSTWLGVPLRADSLIRFSVQGNNGTTAGAAVANQMFRWMQPYPNGEVIAAGQVPQSSGD